MISAYAPGRVELLGNHTDYNEGVVLAGAINRGVTVEGAKRDDDAIFLKSLTLARDFRTSVGAITSTPDEPWANYPLGVVSQFLHSQRPVPGFAMEIHATLPLGGGLSSSAALEVATAMFLLKITGTTMDPMELAILCRRAENDFVGVQSGLLDQATSVFGKADHVVFLDCRENTVRTIPIPSGFALIIADSGTKHSLVHGEYNARREQCQAAAAALGVRMLRDTTSSALQRTAMNSTVKRRATHVVGEMERVWQAVERLEAGDARTFGALMYASHESSRTNFENSTPQLDLLVEIARTLPGVHGARLSGGGFGGSTVTLVDADAAENVAARLAAEYSSRSGYIPQVFVCRLADGAR